jgi:hypothetical protein
MTNSIDQLCETDRMTNSADQLCKTDRMTNSPMMTNSPTKSVRWAG